MITPARLDLAGDRWVAFIRTLPVVNVNLTGATFGLQVRLVPDAAGSPLVDLGTVFSGAAEGVQMIEAATATVSAHIAAGRLSDIPAGYDATSMIAVSVLGIRINETTMEGLPFPSERGGDAKMSWDLHITPTGGVKDKYAGGLFTVRAGVTQ